MRTWIAQNPGAHQGKVVGNGQCVAFVREACGLGHTSTWRKGALARGAGLPSGIALATFSAGPDGRYENRTDGASHVAVLIAEDATGLLVWDQWRGRKVGQRVIRWKGGKGTANNDGDRYYVVMTEDA